MKLNFKLFQFKDMEMSKTCGLEKLQDLKRYEGSLKAKVNGASEKFL